jgi:UDP-N-acetyl-D-mannosaminuronate dehydrogenase
VPELSQLGLSSVDLDEALASADVAAIVTAHPSLDYEAVASAAPILVDFRGVTRGISAENLIRL